VKPALFEWLRAGVMRRAARHYRSKPFVTRNAAPIVSFTFDDVPASAATNGAAILESQGVRGTFYIAAGTLGHADAHWRVIGSEQVSALHANGHEIGCHTFSHVAVEELTAAALEQECRRNRDRLGELCPGIELSNFCYPFGRASLPRKLELQQRFDSCRGIYEGINAGCIDLAMLRVIELYDRTLTPEKLDRALRETRARNGWLIFYTHDVADAPSWIGCSPQLLRATVRAVQAEGMPCLPVRDALAAIGYRASRAEGSADRDQRFGQAGETLALDHGVGE
jgi:peptidoglycan/xylan/chitin deacetylase (PgdA/CDA1 family)